MVYALLGLMLIAVSCGSFFYIRALNRKASDSNDSYFSLFNNSPVALIVLGPNHRIIEWNQASEEMFGYTDSEAIGKEITDLLVPLSDRAHVLSVLAKASKEGVSTSKNFNITKEKEELFCEWRNTKHHETIICMAQDITASKKVLDDLNKRSTALESSGEAILYTNHKGIIEFANRSFFLLCSSDQKQIFASHIGEYLFGNVTAMNAILPQFDADNTWKGTIIKHCFGIDKVFSVVITAIYNRHRLISYIANLHDITELSSHVHALTHQAYHDPLTGATNRSAMDTRLMQAIHHAERLSTKVALFFIDLNDFKVVNDSYGHEVGDKLLSGVAANLRSCLRNTDTISRFGGDEFVIIIEEIKNQEHVDTVYKTIQAAINEPIVIDPSLTITAKASIGMALYPEDAADPDSLIKAADASMYAIKKQKNALQAAAKKAKKTLSEEPVLALYPDPVVQ
ncbi:MAG TPA: diguanylate cyclase [Sulfuricurvum sp.]|nr:diguanylate cyclase [Sulfuricurvum sp.]